MVNYDGNHMLEEGAWISGPFVKGLMARCLSDAISEYDSY